MYIKFVIVQNRNIYVTYWLLLITALVGLMIIIGGLTRLTDSGLSITRWDLFTGVLPPLNDKDWEEAFLLYKEIPEFKLQNYLMTLDQFKIIYFWEYIHRLLGRVIGLFYIIPLFYFTYKKILNTKLLKSFYLIFLLILVQGIIGWYMVKSGLTERTDVSHYRLSLHLTLAFIIFIMLIWNYFKYSLQQVNENEKKIPYFLPNIFLVLIIVQISIGALVSGLDAGKMYNTWPLMNENYFPDDADFNILFSLNAFDNPSILQFIHRNIAYVIFSFFLIIYFFVYKKNYFNYFKNILFSVLFALIIQIVLGIFTVMYGAQIIIASMHQIGSIILVATTVFLIFKNS